MGMTLTNRSNHQALRCLLLALVSLASSATAGEVLIQVTEPSGVDRSGWPVTSGVPFSQGALNDAGQVALFTQEGREIPLQTETLSRWPDGSVRWLLLDFQIDQSAAARTSLVLRWGADIRRAEIEQPLQVVQTAADVTVNTGPLQMKLARESFRLLDQVWLDRNGDGQFAEAERVTSSRGAGIVLTTPAGQQFRADLASAQIVVEQSGPLRACVRIAGVHAADHGEMFRYVLRVHAFRGQPFVRMDYTFINDHQKQLMAQLDSLELVFVHAAGSDRVALLEGQRQGPSRLFQVDDQRFEMDGDAAGKRAAGWAALGDGQGGLAVGVRKFWQNWPKSIAVQRSSWGASDARSNAVPSVLRVGICPSFPEGLYDGKPIREECKLYYYLRDGVYSFKIGAARTHEIWATFFHGLPDNERLGAFFRAADKRLLAQCTPDYVSATQALGRFPAADPQKYFRYDAWLDGFLQLHLEDQAEVREYGLLNYGDWYNINWDSWGNLEYDLARCFFVQYLRTGDRRYFDRAEQAAWHFMDVDVVHAVNPHVRAYAGSANMRPGQIWAHSVGHTGGYYGRYENGEYSDVAPLKMVGAYQLGLYDWGHVWIAGVFDYYQLTGNRRARAVGVLAADTMSDLCPTRYSDHIRGIGWPLNLVVAAYEATGKQEYLQAATKQWLVLKEELDPQKGWVVMLAYGHCSQPSTAERCRGQNAYMLALTLSGLARYHRITQDPEVLQALSVGLDQLIRECWDEQHKSFYLTSCVHGRHNPPPGLCSATFLASEAFAYEYAQTGNEEHRRIFQEAFRTAVNAGFRNLADRAQHGQTGYASMMFHFTPFGLSALED